MSQLLLPVFSGAIIPIVIKIMAVLSLGWNLVHIFNFDTRGEWGWITLLRPRGLFGWLFLPLSIPGSFMGQGLHWIRMLLLSMIGPSPAPAPKALSNWAKITQRASGLFVKKAVEPVRSTGATWALNNMNKLGIPHAAKITDYVSEHPIQMLIHLLMLLVILALLITVAIFVSNSSKKDRDYNSLRSEVRKNSKRAHALYMKMAMIESRQDPLEGSIALLAEVTERHAAQLAPVVIDADQKPALARDLDTVCVATPFVPGYGTGRSSEAVNPHTSHFQDVMHRLLSLRDETPWDAVHARAQE